MGARGFGLQCSGLGLRPSGRGMCALAGIRSALWGRSARAGLCALLAVGLWAAPAQ